MSNNPIPELDNYELDPVMEQVSELMNKAKELLASSGRLHYMYFLGLLQRSDVSSPIDIGNEQAMMPFECLTNAHGIKVTEDNTRNDKLALFTAGMMMKKVMELDRAFAIVVLQAADHYHRELQEDQQQPLPDADKPLIGWGAQGEA